MLPPAPSVEEPVLRVREPLLPAEVVPVVNARELLTPVEPEWLERKLNAPLDDARP